MTPTDPIEDCLSSVLTADERLVRPVVAPFTVTPTRHHADVFEVTADGRQSGRTVEVEDDIRIGHEPGILEQDPVAFAKNPAASQILKDEVDVRDHGTIEGLVLLREIDLRLEASRPRWDIVGRLHVGRAQTSKADVRIVEVRPVGVDEVRSIDADVDHDHAGPRESLRGLEDVIGYSTDHRNKPGERDRGDHVVIGGLGSVGEAETTGLRIEADELVIDT